MPYEYGVVKIKLRRDTAANLSSVVLASGEPAFATDTYTLKIGNGSSAFAALSAIGGTGGGGGGGGSSTFLGLSDSPSAFTSSANKLLAVNSSANAIAFIDNSGATSLQSGDNISLLNNDSGFTSNVGTLINVVEDTTPQLSGTGNIGITSDSRRGVLVDGDNSVHQESASILLRSAIDGDTNEDGLMIMKYGNSGNPHAYIWNYTTGSQIVFGVNNMQSMKLMPDGKLGINQVGTTPSYYLSVNGDAWIKENIQASGFVISGGTSSQFLKADGSVDSTAYGDITSVTAGTGLSGGGTTGSVTINIDNTVVQSGDSITVLNNNNTYVPAATHAGFNQYDIAYWSNASATTLASSLGTRFVIYQGKMGVGKSNPAYRLDVASTGNFDGPVLAESFVKESGTSSQFLKADGSVDSSTYITGATTELSDDTSPVLGGNLDVGGNDIVSTSNGDIDLDPNGNGKVVFKGNSSRGAGQFALNCEFNSHGIVIKGPPHSAGADYTLTLPDTDGEADQNLTTDGSGNLSWTTPSGGGGGGDITSVVAGTGLSGGGTTGDVTVNIDSTVIQSGDNISKLNNDSGFTANVGDITQVTAGTGLSGGGSSGAVTLNVDTTTVLANGGQISRLTNNAGYLTSGTANYVPSNTTTAGGGTQVQNMVTIGAAAYSGLTPNAGTLYFITGA